MELRQGRPVILFAVTSVDGFIAGADGSTPCPAMDGQPTKAWGASVDSWLVGQGQWDRLGGGGLWPVAGQAIYLFSWRPPAKVPARTTAVRTDAARFVAGLKRLAGRAVGLLGGCTLSTALMEAGLVDEVILWVNPVFLGKGTPLWRPAGGRTLELQEGRELVDGVRRYHYLVRPRRPGLKAKARRKRRAASFPAG